MNWIKSMLLNKVITILPKNYYNYKFILLLLYYYYIITNYNNYTYNNIIITFKSENIPFYCELNNEDN